MRHLAMGGVDLQRDLHASNAEISRRCTSGPSSLSPHAAGIERPIDSVYPQLDDETGLREQAQFALSLGFFGKSAIHPRQLSVLHEVFTPNDEEIAWAQEVVAAFDAAGGAALQLPSGEFVDVPVAERAKRVLELAASLRRPRS